jgi:hypothetical protein
MTDEQQDAVIAELVDWFKAKNISSFHGFIIMIKLLTRMHHGAMKRMLNVQREAANTRYPEHPRAWRE